MYVTLNTILTNDALKEAQKLIWQLSEIGVDGLIIQDLGLLECTLPPIPLIASTQTTNLTPEHVLFLEKVGFTRVILERAISLERIKQIRAQTKVDLEMFVHGSICVSYSGKCYLSYAHGKRSANLGMCAQPCRQSYSLVDAQNGTLVKDRFLLSMKDLNLSQHLEELLDAGITSFKIEGRLKEDDYVSNVTAYYRQELDKILVRKGLKKSSSGSVSLDFEPNLAKSFNRGFTDYFISGKQTAVANTLTPKSMGEKIGIIGEVTWKYFTLITQETLQNGDGICFVNEQGHLVGTRVNVVEGDKIFPEEIRFLKSGQTLYRNYDNNFLKVLKSPKTQRKIKIDLVLEITQELMALEIRDEDNLQTKINLAVQASPAQQNNDSKLEESLAKLGNTIYAAQSIAINAHNLFVPIKEVNELRRQAIEKHSQKRLLSYELERKTLEANHYPYSVNMLDFSANILNQKAVDFYKKHGVEYLDKAAEVGASLINKPLMTMRYCVLQELGFCLKEKKLSLPLFLVDDKSHKMQLKFDCNTCQVQIMGDI